MRVHIKMNFNHYKRGSPRGGARKHPGRPGEGPSQSPPDLRGGCFGGAADREASKAPFLYLGF